MKTRKRQSARIDKTRSRFADGIANPLLRIGTGTQNTFNPSTYRPQWVTLNRQTLEWAYQTSWMASLAVDIVAEDMTREGFELQDTQPEIADKINKVADRYGVLDSLCDAIKWSRLYGGAIAVILVDGQDVSKPLTDVPIGTFRGLCVLDRWQLDSVTNDLVTELGPDFGKPEYYRIISENAEVKFTSDRIHHSRVLRMDGRKLPYYLRQSYQGWGASILEPAWNQIRGFDLGTQSATQLLSKTYLRYYKVEGLREILTNDYAAKGFLKQMDYVREFQSSEGMTLGDKEDDFQTFSYSFTGIPEVLLQLGQQVSGAFGIPLVRLFGQSPAGLNSTGESDLRNYYDSVKKLQRSMLRTNLRKLLDVIYQSVTGDRPPAEFDFNFAPLWQMTQSERALVTQQTATTIADSYDRGLLSLDQALTELKKLSGVVGVFSSITDEDIAEAKEMEQAQLPPNPDDYAYGNIPEEGKPGVPRADENGSDRTVVQETPDASSQTGRTDR